jgi:hypothetical protein
MNGAIYHLAILSLDVGCISVWGRSAWVTDPTAACHGPARSILAPNVKYTPGWRLHCVP